MLSYQQYKKAYLSYGCDHEGPVIGVDAHIGCRVRAVGVLGAFFFVELYIYYTKQKRGALRIRDEGRRSGFPSHMDMGLRLPGLALVGAY